MLLPLLLEQRVQVILKIVFPQLFFHVPEPVILDEILHALVVLGITLQARFLQHLVEVHLFLGQLVFFLHLLLLPLFLNVLLKKSLFLADLFHVVIPWVGRQCLLRPVPFVVLCDPFLLQQLLECFGGLLLQFLLRFFFLLGRILIIARDPGLLVQLGLLSLGQAQLFRQIPRRLLQLGIVIKNFAIRGRDLLPLSTHQLLLFGHHAGRLVPLTLLGFAVEVIGDALQRLVRSPELLFVLLPGLCHVAFFHFSLNRRFSEMPDFATHLS